MNATKPTKTIDLIDLTPDVRDAELVKGGAAAKRQVTLAEYERILAQMIADANKK